ncbi:MAG: hypothetical protein WBG42_06000 [Cryomorphaceae bacterium]
MEKTKSLTDPKRFVSLSSVISLSTLNPAYPQFRSEYLFGVLKFKEEDNSVDFGKWDLKAIVELGVVLLSGYLILMNAVPLIAASINYFVDAVGLKYPYNTEPNRVAYGDQYYFITSGVSILLGVVILTNVPWFIVKILGKYGERVEE